MFKGIIFDFDGVIVESEVAYVNTIVEYLRRKGINTTFDECSYVCGQQEINIIGDIIKQFSLNSEPEATVEEIENVYDELINIKELKPIDGFIDFINKCKALGIRMCIVSSCDLPTINTILDNFKVKDYFEFIYSADDHFKSKPNPESYLSAIDKWKIDKKDLMIIEDSPIGIQAAIQTGVYTVGLKASLVKQDTSKANKEVYSYAEIDLENRA